VGGWLTVTSNCSRGLTVLYDKGSLLDDGLI